MDDQDWIFSDEAHQWMDLRRREHASRPTGICVGWEFGLFGLKPLSNSGQPYTFYASNALHDPVVR